MNTLVRWFAIPLLMVFALGTVAQAANATTMSIAMSPAAMADVDMDDCDGCPPGDAKTSLCIDFCLAPFSAILAAVGVELPVVTPDLPALPSNEFNGRTGPPDPFPPRTIIL